MLRKIVALVLVGVALSIVLVVAWGVVVEPRLIDVEEETIRLERLPAEWNGRRIALIADFQVGMWLANTGTARRIVRRLVEEKPAAVLIAGDFLYKADDTLDELIAEAVGIVQPLADAGIPTFAVLGNHDYSLDLRDDSKNSEMAKRLRAALETAGIRVLHNEAVPVPLGTSAITADAGAFPVDTAALHVVGIGSHWAKEDAPEAAIDHVPVGAPYVVLMHNPRSFERISAGRAPVAFAAHTHGGQIRVPFKPDWSWLTLVKEDSLHVDGWSRGRYGEDGNNLYVNRGIGFSDVPVRINCRPEMTLFTLEGI